MNLNDVVRSVESRLREVVGDRATVEVRLDSMLRRARVDPTYVSKALVALVSAACTASRSGSRIRVETRSVYLDGDAARERDLPVGHYARVSVGNATGAMHQPNHQHVFDAMPNDDSGGGLELLSVHRFARQSHGYVGCWSDSGHDKTFELLLPAAEEPGDHATAQPGDPTRKAVVLVVDDELNVRNTVSRALVRSGYDVVAAASGAEAIAQLGRNGFFDLLLSDVLMPDMSGPELATAVLSANPSLPIVFMSGFAPDTVFPQQMNERAYRFLQKPFTAEQLVRVVKMAVAGD